MKVLKYLSIIIIGLLAVTLLSCGGSGDGSGSSGKLSLSLSDATTSDYKAVYVTIAQIQVHRADAEEGEWKTVLTPNATYNLLELINGETAALGVADLPTGKYTQMRLILSDTPDPVGTNILDEPHPYANYLISKTDEPIKLNVPSGFKTGIKLVHPFDVVAGRTVGLVLDFDAGRSVVKAGSSGKWQLKPTIKVIDTLNNATLTGTVKNGSAIAVSGVTVSAQTYNASAAEEQRVTIVASTLTDENGGYLMYLTPGTYTIVVVADGLVTSTKKIIVAYDTAYTEDFTLAPTDMGFITIELTLPLSGDPATIEFRQISPSDTTQQIAVKEVNYSENGTSYTVDLPVGTYNVVATCAGNILTVNDAVVVKDGGNTIKIDFTTP
jgi:hypothetical protein